MAFDRKSFSEGFDITPTGISGKKLKRKIFKTFNTIEELLNYLRNNVPTNVEALELTLEYRTPITRTLTNQQVKRPSIEGSTDPDPTRTLVHWNELSNRVEERATILALNSPTTEAELRLQLALMQEDILSLFEQSLYFFMVKGDFYATEEMNRLSPSFHFATEWTPNNEELYNELLDGCKGYVAKWSDAILKDAVRAINDNIGGSTQQIGEAVAEVLYAKTNRGVKIARTETMRAFNRVAYQRYQNAGFDMDWITAHDFKVCDECEPKHRQPVETVGVPPEHPECRCTIVPRLK